MGRQAIISALCWVIQGTLAVNLVLNDNLSANNVKRLYRNVATNGAVPYGMYRYGTVMFGANPYGVNQHGGAVGAYTYQVPYAISPKAAASQPRPAVSNAKFVQDTSNIYLKDSYGNKYVPTPNSVPLKPLTPQQFLQLQALPAHLVQPLTATPFNFNYKQAPGTQQIVYGSQYKPVQQTPPGAHYVYEQAHPGGNTQAVKTLAEYTPSPYQTNPTTSAQPLKSTAEYAPSYFQTQFGISNQFWNQYAPQSQPTSSLTYEPPSPTFASAPEPDPASEEHVPFVPVQQQSTSNNKVVYSVSTISPPSLQYTYTTPKPKRYQDSEEIYDEEKRDAVRTVKAKLKKHNANVASVKTTVNGKKTIVNIETKPTLPLLDISLLEPLTFNNPILPQVQHYLPRIHDANYVRLSDVTPKEKKYQKEYVIQKTKHYDSGYVKPKPKKEPKKPAPKRKTPSVEIITFDDEIAQASTARPQVIIKDETLKNIPEKTYEISGPGYKEVIQEKAVSYNKETNSEPVHYTYGTHKTEEPVHFTYSHSSKEPLHIKSIHYEGHGEGPKGKKTVEHKEIPKPENHSGESGDSSGEDDPPHYHEDDNNHEEKSHHLKPEHREEEYHHHSGSPSSEQDYSQYFSEDSGFHPVAQYEEEIRVVSPEKVEKEHEQNQHLVAKQEIHKPQQNDHHHQAHYHQKPQHSEVHHQPQNQPQREFPHQPQHQPQKEFHHQPQPQKEYHPQPQQNPQKEDHHKEHHYEPQHKEHHYEPQPQHKEPQYVPQYNEHHFEPLPQHKEHQNRPTQLEHLQHHQAHGQQHPRPPQQAPQTQSHPVHVQEKTKKVYIKEETPAEDESPKDTTIDEDDSEQDFEKAYKNAAYGFPAFDSHDNEKDIYNPANYGIPRQSSDYKAEHSPFQQYFEKGDNFPKATRLNYLDARDKTKDNYFLDFSINHPQFMADRYTKKVDYLKLYQKQKPENYFAAPEGNKKEKQRENYAAIPYDFYQANDKMPKLAFAQMTTIPQEFDFSKFKGDKKDSYAFASKPLYTYKLNTHFVEPQYQYGFEPVGLPRLLDSELAAMATNVSPESEKPGMRKKIYKENFYIKKTSLTNGSNS